MSRKFSLGLFCTLALLSFNSFATTQEVLSINSKIHREFLANSQLELTNFLPWKIIANCQITTENDDLSDLGITLLNKGHTCLIDGEELKYQVEKNITIEKKRNLSLQVDSGSSIRLTNKSSQTITIDCEN